MSESESTSSVLAAPTLSDDGFDALIPAEFRQYSKVHWTPAAAAMRAVQWLAPMPGMRILDVGCGVGKLCVIGALWTRAEWYGVEQHGALVKAATELARVVGVAKRIWFLHGDALALGWGTFDSFYFYNPFATDVLEVVDGGDPDERYDRILAAIRARLETLRPGTRVVTYHGIGGRMPPSYELVQRERIAHSDLELWIQSSCAAGPVRSSSRQRATGTAR